jgi:type 1 glutamine amidotransferase
MSRFRLTLLLLFALVSSVSAQSKRVLLLAQGPDGHPPKTHEYVAGQEIVRDMLNGFNDLDVSLVRTDEPWREGPELLAKADAAVLFLSEGAKWLHQDPKRLAAFQDLAKRKGGLAVLHWAMGTKEAKNIDGFVALFGACHGGPDRKYKVLATKATLPTDKHPIVRGLAPFAARDEFYYSLKRVKGPAAITPIVNVDIDGNSETVAWAFDRPDSGRSFGFSGLHFHENWDMPEYRRLVLQGVLWTLGRDVPRGGVAEEKLFPRRK